MLGTSLKIVKEQRPLQEVRSVIGVAAGKGGVGKSTVAVHLARALKEKGYRVGLLDADVYGPSLRKMLPEGQLPEKRGGLLYPALSEGIEFISMAHFREEHEAAAVRAPVANGLIAQFIEAIHWGPLDVLVIDFPPGTGDIQLTLCQKSSLSGVVIVTTPQQVAALDVLKAMQLFKKMAVPLLGIVENMSYFKPDSSSKKLFPFGEGAGESLAKREGIPLLAKIPLDPEVSLTGDAGRSLFEEKSVSETVEAFRALASSLEGKIAPLKRPVIYLKSPSLLAIEEEETPRFIPIAELQKKCPCALCHASPPKVDPEVTASHMTWVGNYAFRLKFSSGCSSGIWHQTNLLT